MSATPETASDLHISAFVSNRNGFLILTFFLQSNLAETLGHDQGAWMYTTVVVDAQLGCVQRQVERARPVFIDPQGVAAVPVPRSQRQGTGTPAPVCAGSSPRPSLWACRYRRERRHGEVQDYDQAPGDAPMRT